MKVSIRNWEKFHPRKDIKHPSWFACSNRMIEDADFYSLTHGEFKAWIYIMSIASQKSSSTVFLNFDHADRVCRISRSEFESAIEKLKQMQIISDDVTDTSRECDGHDTRQTHRQTDTQGEIPGSPEPGEPAVEVLAPKDLVELWNKTAHERLSAVSKLTPSRTKSAKARLTENPDPEYWIQAIQKLNKSDFLLGLVPSRDRAKPWRADFDWFIQPDSIVKLLEGKYDR